MGNTAGVILAAGASSRMGKFKPMLPVFDTTCIKKIINNMKAVDIEDIYVVTGYNGRELERHLLEDDVICIRNKRFYETEMLESLKLAIAALNPNIDRILMTPVDIFMVSQESYYKLLSEDGDIVRAVYEGKCGHPVLLERKVFPIVLSSNSGGGLRKIIRNPKLNVRYLELDDEAILMDADTMDDYRRMLSYAEDGGSDFKKLRPELCLQFSTDKLLFDENFINLLRLIEETGSLQRASMAMHISYTKAWKLLKSIENQTKRKLVDRVAGGEYGGKSELTLAGRELLSRYIRARKDLDLASRAIFQRCFKDFYI